MTKRDSRRAIAILAKSTYRDLKDQGYSRAEIMAFASDLLEQLAEDAKRLPLAIPAE